MEAKKTKTKKPVGKATKAGNSPIPSGPCGGSSFDEMNSICGHSTCSGGKCRVRFVGPTTHIRDHHIVHAARGASHVWTAAIVAGLAVVLTGAIGYAAFGADTSGGSIYGEFQQLNQRFDKIEQILSTITSQCQVGSKCTNPQNTCDTSYVNTCQAKCQEIMPTAATNAIPLDACKKNCEIQCTQTKQCTDVQIKSCKDSYLKNAEAIGTDNTNLTEKLQSCLKICSWPADTGATQEGYNNSGNNYTSNSSTEMNNNNGNFNFQPATSSAGNNQGGVENTPGMTGTRNVPTANIPSASGGNNQGGAENTPGMTGTAAAGGAGTVSAADMLAACNARCHTARLTCATAAGSDYQKLVNCMMTETKCKTVCSNATY